MSTEVPSRRASSVLDIDVTFSEKPKAQRGKKKPHVRSPHAATLASTFDELPLPFEEWATSPDHMALDHEYSAVQKTILRHAEQIYFPDLYTSLATEDLRWRPVRFVNELWLMIGKGGGKDHMAAITQLRIAYLLLCLRSPQRYFNIGSTSKIHLFNAATSEGHGLQVYRAEFSGLLENSPWFRGKHHPIAKETTFDKSVISISGNSKEDSGEGYNLLLAVLDEIDAFRTKEELESSARTQRGKLLNAEGIYHTVKYSAESRFPANYKVMGLSWPRYVGSFIWEAHHAGLEDMKEVGDASRTYVIPNYYGASTWEANPTKSKEQYAEAYRLNPEEAAARYECRPPASESPFFRNSKALEENFRVPFPDDTPPLEIEYFWGLDEAKSMEVSPAGELVALEGVQPAQGFQTRFHFADWFRADRMESSAPRAVHVDIGLKRDRCGFAMSHVREWSHERVPDPDRPGHYNDVSRPLVTTDLLTYFAAPYDPEHGHGEIEIRWVRALIFALIGRGFPIGRVTFDGFQSADAIQLLNAWGVEAGLYSLDRNTEGYDTAKSVLYAGGLRSHHDPLLLKELRALTLFKGKKVDHPPGGSKDLADAWAGSVFGAIKLMKEGGAGTSSWLHDSGQPTAEAPWGSPPASATGNLTSGVPVGLGGFAGLPPERGRSRR